MNNQHIPNTNALGVSPSQFEQIKNLQYLLGELEFKLTKCRDNKIQSLKMRGKPISKMSSDASEKQRAEAIDLYGHVRQAAGRLNYNLAFDDSDVFSVCCGVSPENLGDYDSAQIGLCPKCKEPTEFI